MLRTFFYIIWLSITIISCTSNPAKEFSPYLSMEPPSDSAVLFAPGIVSTGLYERDFSMTPDGKEIYYSIMSSGFSVIACVKYKDGQWTNPEVASFSGNPDYFDAEPHISPDGQQLLFLSTRPKPGQEPKPDWSYQDIWIADREGSDWGEPYNPGEPLNTDAGEYFPSVTFNGTIYFTREEETGGQAIYRSKKVNGKYAEAERLPNEVNPGKMQYNSFVPSDESYIVVCTRLKPEDRHASYCISFRSPEDKWTPLISMGDKVNFPGSYAINMYQTPDGKYLFFGASSKEKLNQNSGNLTYEFIRLLQTQPQNGNFDLYWISADLINDLKNNSKQNLTK